MEEANRDEAERCVRIAKKAFSDNQAEKAEKFIRKAYRLYPSESTAELLAHITSDVKENEPPPQCNGDATPSGYSAFDHYADSDGVRNRRQRQASLSPTRTAPSSTHQSRPRQRSRSAHRPAEPEYTAEQVEIVQRIRKSNTNHYEVLGLSKTFSEADLKKSYRKVALQVHPDKNKAPGASEAFKAVGTAYAVLSNAERRRHYDAYGTDDSNATAARSRRGGHHHAHYRHEWDDDINPEDIFNMFFGGGFPTGQVYRRGGTYYYTRGRMNRQEEDDETRQGDTSATLLMQLMPFFLLIVLSLLSTWLVGDPTYSLERTDRYVVQRLTTDMRVSYFVKPEFEKKFTGNLKRLEKQVEEDYIDSLKTGCYRERLNREHRIWHARSYGDAAAYERAQKTPTPSCEKLNNIRTHPHYYY